MRQKSAHRHWPPNARPQAALVTFPWGSDFQVLSGSLAGKPMLEPRIMGTGEPRSRNNALILLVLFVQPHSMLGMSHTAVHLILCTLPRELYVSPFQRETNWDSQKGRHLPEVQTAADEEQEWGSELRPANPGSTC